MISKRAKELSQKSGVISFVYLVKLMRTLGIIHELDSLFKKDEITDLKLEIKESKSLRKRVRK